MLRLTAQRELKGWSRAELARRSAMRGSTVGQIEATRLVAYDSQLRKLADALGWTGKPADLLEEVQYDEPR